MSGISSFLLAFCVVAIGIGALYMLCPKGSISKSVKYVLCLVFICSLLPLLSVFKGFTVSTDTSFIYRSASANELAKTAIKNTFQSALKKENIDFEKIEVVTDNFSSERINITEVIIYSPSDKQKTQRLFDEIKDFKVSIKDE